MRAGSSGLCQPFSELTIASYAKIVSAWEACSGLSSIILLLPSFRAQGIVSQANSVLGMTRLSEPMCPDSKEVLLIPVSALKRGKIASSRCGALSMPTAHFDRCLPYVSYSQAACDRSCDYLVACRQQRKSKKLPPVKLGVIRQRMQQELTELRLFWNAVTILAVRSQGGDLQFTHGTEADLERVKQAIALSFCFFFVSPQ
jgi:hypothetical protein